MGEALDKLVALAGTVRVEAHKRTTKTGKVVSVDAHTRSPAKLLNTDLISEIRDLTDGKGPGTEAQKKNRLTQLRSEQRKRIADGVWDPYAKVNPYKTDGKKRTPAPEKLQSASSMVDAQSFKKFGTADYESATKKATGPASGAKSRAEHEAGHWAAKRLADKVRNQKTKAQLSDAIMVLDLKSNRTEAEDKRLAELKAEWKERF